MNLSSTNAPAEEFSQMLRRYSPIAYRMAYRMTGGREAEARDLVQDVFIKIWRRWPEQRPDSFEAWLYRLLRNLYLDALRRQVRQRSQSLDVTRPDSEEPWEPSTPGAGNGHDAGDIQNDVSVALQKVDLEFRTPVILCDLEGLSYDEIAQVLACPVGTVRSRIHRGREQLRRILSPHYATEVNLI